MQKTARETSSCRKRRGEVRETKNRPLFYFICCLLSAFERRSGRPDYNNPCMCNKIADDMKPAIAPETTLNKAIRKSCFHCCLRSSFSFASLICCSRIPFGIAVPFAIGGISGKFNVFILLSLVFQMAVWYLKYRR